ncbi:alpha/beta hydrolase family protein [Roseimaritima sediminicola]|uniref:alpha/beta hydrolase family protein n=1 Tax=Roseimaritima sediminicola TaxID=2662066 RepID=UPI0012982E92|nr:acetylxylan esterase [Roseimaritima sediminicola]
MRQRFHRLLLRPTCLSFPFVIAAMLLTPPASCHADDASRSRAASQTADGDALLAEYFAEQTRRIADACFAEIETLEDWTDRREQYREQLLDMLGLNPMPARSDLQVTVTGQDQQDGVVVERLHFQSMPGLYVTGNLYRPAEVTEPLPAVLYVCGHGRVVKDGISYGNKVHYQHHGGWFARNGYVCLTIDTIQLGEIEGIHHGTYREKMWWWNNRGYTPVGVEAWNGVRALDLLQARDDVDPERIGVTGRSGGGAYSWYLAAIDSRVGAAVPVAGITNMHNHVVDGCVSGHCDCMYMVNTYRWDFPMLAALIAPRPLLISNTDRDRIFPLDGVVDVHAKVRQIYQLYDAEENLGLHITSGGHSDTQELRIHAFRWLNHHLRDDDSLIDTVATKLFEPSQLKVFEGDSVPADERTSTIHESFVPAASVEDLKAAAADPKAAFARWKQQLRSHTFGGWPQSLDAPPKVTIEARVDRDDATVLFATYLSQDPFRLPLVVVVPKTDAGSEASAGEVTVRVLNEADWQASAAALAAAAPQRYPNATADTAAWATLATADGPTVLLAPRGVGPTGWTQDERDRTHVRRRFMLLGQTVAGMQVFDVLRGLQAIAEIPDSPVTSRPLHIDASGPAAAWALYATLFAPEAVQQRTASLQLEALPVRNRQAPDLLNVSRIVELPAVVAMAAREVPEVRIGGETRPAWQELATEQPLLEPLRFEQP